MGFSQLNAKQAEEWVLQKNKNLRKLHRNIMKALKVVDYFVEKSYGAGECGCGGPEYGYWSEHSMEYRVEGHPVYEKVLIGYEYLSNCPSHNPSETINNKPFKYKLKKKGFEKYNSTYFTGKKYIYIYVDPFKANLLKYEPEERSNDYQI